VEELVSLLFVENRVCSIQPTRVKHNYSFLVDLNCVTSTGRLVESGNINEFVKVYCIVENPSKTMVCHTSEKPPPMDDVTDNNSLYLLTRVYHDLQASPDFKRMIATLTS